MKWTTKKPEVEGLYWLTLGAMNTNFNQPEGVPFLVRVYKHPYQQNQWVVSFVEHPGQVKNIGEFIYECKWGLIAKYPTE